MVLVKACFNHCINSNLCSEEFEVTQATAGNLSAIGIYDKAANKVSIHFAVTGAGGTPNGRETIFTIPSKYAPSEVKMEYVMYIIQIHRLLQQHVMLILVELCTKLHLLVSFI